MSYFVFSDLSHRFFLSLTVLVVDKSIKLDNLRLAIAVCNNVKNTKRNGSIGRVGFVGFSQL